MGRWYDTGLKTRNTQSSGCCAAPARCRAIHKHLAKTAIRANG